MNALHQVPKVQTVYLMLFQILSIVEETWELCHRCVLMFNFVYLVVER